MLRESIFEIRCSSLLENPAIDREGNLDPQSPAYLNAVLFGETDLSPDDLFRFTREIERKLGRRIEEKSQYLPRTIDIDLLWMEDDDGVMRIDSEELVLPHPKIGERTFVKEPMREIGFDLTRLPPEEKKGDNPLLREKNDRGAALPSSL